MRDELDEERSKSRSLRRFFDRRRGYNDTVDEKRIRNAMAERSGNGNDDALLSEFRRMGRMCGRCGTEAESLRREVKEELRLRKSIQREAQTQMEKKVSDVTTG